MAANMNVALEILPSTIRGMSVIVAFVEKQGDSQIFYYYEDYDSFKTQFSDDHCLILNSDIETIRRNIQMEIEFYFQYF